MVPRNRSSAADAYVIDYELRFSCACSNAQTLHTLRFSNQQSLLGRKNLQYTNEHTYLDTFTLSLRA